MIRKNLSILLILSLISGILPSCKAAKKEEPVATIPQIPVVENEVNPYYSITTQYASHRVNYFMDVDIKIPKITYTGIERDELFDSINDELYNNITKLVKDAMNESFNSYTDYLETAKSNVLIEQESRMRGLKTKYKDVISDKEIAAINETIENLKIVAKENKENSEKLKEVNGFSGTEGLIVPELHNKKIIIVETTAASESETKEKNEIASSENTRPSFGNGERKKRSTASNTESDISKAPNRPQKEIVASKSNVNNDTKKTSENEKIVTRASESNVNKKLTLKDFYDEFGEILSVKTPTDEELTKAYTPTIINCNFDVKCLDEDYLSLFVEMNVTKTATSITRLFYNIDLRKKRLISIKDVLGDNYKELCINSINSAIDKMTIDQKKNINSDFNLENIINEKTNFFINNNHIPVVELDKYTMTPDYLEFQILK